MTSVNDTPPDAPASPVTFAPQRRPYSPSPSSSSIVLDISAPADASQTVVVDDDIDEKNSAGEDVTISETRNEDDGENEKTFVSAPPPRGTGMRLLGINYFPPVQEETDSNTPHDSYAQHHPLRLDVSPPTWEREEPTESVEGADEWNLKGGATRSFQHQQKISVARRTRPPVSAFPFGPPPSDSAFGTDPVGQLGVHHPREIVRVERDYSGGEIVQFAPAYPLEFEGRITPTQFLETINAFNEILISAYSLRHGFIDNVLDILTLRLSKLIVSTHYDKEMRRLRQTMDKFNVELYNPVGLNILWPRRVGFLFLEIEYY